MSNPSKPRAGPVVVVGAGIAGLSAAWELARRGLHDVRVLEAGSRAGGTIATEEENGFRFELGPDAFLTRKTAVAELCAEIGFDGEIIGCLSAAVRTRILHQGTLQPVPEGWQMLAPGSIRGALATPLLPAAAKLRIAWRALRPPPRAHGEESVAQFLERNFGPEIVSAVAEPMLAGVYGGDPEELSISEIMPGLAKLGAGGRPLLPQLRRQSRPGAENGSPFSSLRAGMGSLVAALVRALDQRLAPAWLHLDWRVERLEARPEGRWRLYHAGGTCVDATAVVLALPAWSAAAMLAPEFDQLAAVLAQWPYRPACTVNLAYAPAPSLPDGYGFLVPRGEGLSMLACTFAHQKFAGRAPSGGALLRVSLRRGGERGNAVEAARRELAQVLGLHAEPVATRVAHWPGAMPQYNVGHQARLADVIGRLPPGLHLAGSAWRGIGIPDCIQSGRQAAREIVDGA